MEHSYDEAAALVATHESNHKLNKTIYIIKFMTDHLKSWPISNALCRVQFRVLCLYFLELLSFSFAHGIILVLVCTSSPLSSFRTVNGLYTLCSIFLVTHENSKVQFITTA